MKTFMQFCLGTLLATALATAGVIQNGPNFDVTYDVNLGGTLTGNPITTVVLLEADGQGHSSVQQYPSSLNALGLTSIFHTLSFAPTQALVLGVNLPAPGGDGKTHIFMVVNDAFAANVGIKFNVLFPNTSYTEFKARQAAMDATQEAWFLNFFLNGDGAAAAFSPNGAFTPVEFTALAPIGTPEPSTLLLVGAAAIALFVRRQR